MKTYAIINSVTNIVENTIVWDGVSLFEVSENVYLVESDEGRLGWVYDPIEETFTDPNPISIPTPIEKTPQ